MPHIFKSSFSVLALSLALTACSYDNVHSDVKIYDANTVVTVNPAMPSASAVAVRNGEIIGVGSLETLAAEFSGAQIDNRFKDKTLVPGLIDPHVHIMLGAMMYGLPMAPPWDVQTQDGTIKGLGSQEEFLNRVSEIYQARKNDQPMIVFGFHNLVHGELSKTELDKIAPDTPLIIWHYSGHDFYFNSAAIEQFGFKKDLAEKFHGIDLGDDGELTGRIYEDAAMVAFGAIGHILVSPEQMAAGYNGFETILTEAGVTGIAEMGYGIFGRSTEDTVIKNFYTANDSYRLFLVPEHRAFSAAYKDDAIAKMQAIPKTPQPIGTPRGLNQVKLFTDAAFYSQTMKLTPPGYIAGQSKGTDGLWVIKPEDMRDTMEPYWNAGMDIHIHSNGDRAQDSTIDGFSNVKSANQGREGQRLIIEHAGLLRPGQLDRAAELGIGLSAASHYVHYMGGTYSESIGERVKFITPLASAAKRGMPVTLHSDAPLAPPQPLRAASVHITRSTRQGGVSTASEQLTREQALRAVTWGAAWSLGLEAEYGSIEVGKRADFTVLDQNPMETDGADWPSIGVWGVVLDGAPKPVKP